MGVLRLAAEVGHLGFFRFLRFLGLFDFRRLCAFLGMGMLLLLADQCISFIIAAFPMGVLRLAAEVAHLGFFRFFGFHGFLRLPVGGTFLGMGVLLHSTGELPGAVAAGTVGMTFLRIGAGQCLGVQGDRNRPKAGAGMLMGQNLTSPADHIAAVIEAAFRVRMEDYLPSFANQHRLQRLRSLIRLPANQNLLPLVATVRMFMGGLLHLAAGLLPVGRIAALPMDVALGFLLITEQASLFIAVAFSMGVALAFGNFTHQSRAIRVAFLRMDMARLRRLRADQTALLQGVAILRMDMGRRCLREEIAGVPMSVGADLGQRAPKGAVFVPAGIIMVMYNEIGIAAHRTAASVIAPSGMTVDAQRIRRAHQSLLLLGSHLGIARVGMGMLRKDTLTFHRDGRKDQRVGDAEHHHRRQAGYHLMPVSFYPILLRVFLCIQLHIAVTILYDLSPPKSGKNCRYGDTAGRYSGMKARDTSKAEKTLFILI